MNTKQWKYTRLLPALVAGFALLLAANANAQPTDTGWTQNGQSIYSFDDGTVGTVNESGIDGTNIRGGSEVGSVAGVATDVLAGTFNLGSINISGTMREDGGKTSLYGFLSFGGNGSGIFTGKINDG
jgi:hypothetical protein